MVRLLAFQQNKIQIPQQPLKPIKELRKTIIFINILVIFLAIVLGIFFSYSISKSLTKLSNCINEVSKGNFNVNIPKKIGNIDEIKKLADSLNRIMVTMKRAVVRAKEKR